MKRLAEFIIEKREKAGYSIYGLAERATIKIEVLEEISNNTKLNDKEKKSYYDKIFDYVEDVNGSFENKIKDIYKKGVKEGLETMLMLSSNGEEKETLKKCLKQ